MEAYFNELSLIDEKLTYLQISSLSNLYRAFQNYDISVCWINHDSFQRICKAANRIDTNHQINNFLYAFFRMPYSDSKNLEMQEEEFYLHKYLFEQDTLNDHRVLSIEGLAYAFITDSLSLSLNIHPWNNSIINILVDEQKSEVYNAFDADHIKEISKWLTSHAELQLLTTDQDPRMKKIHIRDDHGKDILDEFAKKIVNSPYVIEVTNSMPFHPHQRKFIHNIYADGKVSIVLPWTDKGLGIIIQTTGRNLRETEEIAQILADKYNAR